MTTKNDRRYCVYMLRFPATGEPFYIGKGLCCRPQRHYTPSSRKVKHPKNDILNNFDTYYTVEREGLTNDEANAYEKELIALWGFENLTNLTRGGSGTDGCIVSAETRAKQSEAKRGRGLSPETLAKISGENHHMFGKSHSLETRTKISEAQSGEKGHWFGKNLSTETRAKQSEAVSGDKHPAYDTTVYNFQHKDGRIEACTQYELRIKYNLIQSHLSGVVRGKRKSTGGWGLVI